MSEREDSAAGEVSEGATTAPRVARADEDAGAAPEPAIGTVIDGRYTLLERLGAGGMAVVYRAHEQGLFSRDVALKLLASDSAPSQTTIQRFLQEAQAVAQVRHPNVVSLLHAGRTEAGQLYLAMELLQGATLSAELAALRARGEVFTWARLGPIALQICAALQAAHKRGIVHRDIKPGNCFVVRDDDGGPEFVKVLDFGIAKVLPLPTDAAREDTPLTREGMFLGTPHYAAPEVIEPRADRPVDGRADMFAVGVMLYQLLTGTLPFAGHPVAVVLHKTANVRPPPPRTRAPQRNIPADVEALIVRATAIDPSERFLSMSAMAAAIRATLGAPSPSMSLPAVAGGPSPDEATPRQPVPVSEPGPRTLAEQGWTARRRPLWLAGTAAMVLGVLVVGTWTFKRVTSDRSEETEARPAAEVRAPVAATPAVAPAPAAPAVAPAEVAAPPVEEELAEGAPGPDRAALAARKRRIAGQVRGLAQDPRILGCFLGHVPLGVGRRTEIGGSVVVAAGGEVLRATVKPAEGASLPAAARTCVEGQLAKTRFASGPQPRVTVPVKMEIQ